ncbi:MAG: quaternary ammonium compound efflux SMR transporter SugE [bacterium]
MNIISHNWAWIILFFAGLCEIAWATGLKYSEGFSRFWASVYTVIFMILSFYLLALALRTLPLGTAYAVWTGIGAVGTAILGIFLFQESADLWRILCMMLIIAGIIGLKMVSGE